MGNSHQAEQYYLRALTLRKEVHQEFQTEKSKQDLLDSEQELSRLRTAMNKVSVEGFVSAPSHSSEKPSDFDIYTISAPGIEALVVCPDTREAAIRLVKDAYAIIANDDTAEYYRAEMFYQQALKIYEKLLKENPSLQAKSDVSTTCFNLGYLYELLCGEENYKQAEALYQQAIRIDEELYQEDASIQRKENLIKSYEMLMYLYKTLGESLYFVQLEKIYLRFIELYEDLYDELQDDASWKNMMESFDDLVDFYEKIDAEAYQKKIREITIRKHQKQIELRKKRENEQVQAESYQKPSEEKLGFFARLFKR